MHLLFLSAIAVLVIENPINRNKFYERGFNIS